MDMTTCTVTTAADGGKCGAPAVRTFTTTRGATYAECADHDMGDVLDKHAGTVQTVTPTRTPTRKMTPHQREVYNRLSRFSVRDGKRRWIAGKDIGCAGALAHLVDKGYVEVDASVRGPRGAVRYFYRPTAWR